jgi:hypothetical protein
MSVRSTLGLGVIGLGLALALATTSTAEAEDMYTSHTAAVTSTAFTRDLAVGSMGAEVMALQNWLMSKGFAIKAGATGYFGGQTRAALARYQTSVGISPAAGYFGRITRSSINEQLSPTDPLGYFMESVLIEVRRTNGNNASLGLGGGVDGFLLLKTYQNLQPSDFVGVRARGGEYSVKNGELVFTGNAASDSGTLTQEGMSILLRNVAIRLNMPVQTKFEIQSLLSRLKFSVES